MRLGEDEKGLLRIGEVERVRDLVGKVDCMPRIFAIPRVSSF